MADKKSEFKIMADHIFYCFNYEKDQVEIYVANSDYSIFKTPEQFLNKSGVSDVKRVHRKW